MKQFLFKLLTLLLYIIAAGLAYLGCVMPFPSFFMNIILFIIAIFVLLQACACTDKIIGLGDYSKKM